MLSSLAAAFLAAAPAAPPPLPPELPLFSGDLPSLEGVARPPPKGGVKGGSFTEVVQPKGCANGVAVDLGRVMHVGLTWIEKLQAWLDQSPGLEAKLFSGKGTLGEVSKLASGARAANDRFCELPSSEGWKLVPSRAPQRACTSPSPRLGDYWWLHAGKAAAVVGVSNNGKAVGDLCAVRLSTVLFDQTGKARLQLHNSLTAPPSFTLLGDYCRNVEFTWDEKLNGFKARPSKCKP